MHHHHHHQAVFQVTKKKSAIYIILQKQASQLHDVNLIGLYKIIYKVYDALHTIFLSTTFYN